MNSRNPLSAFLFAIMIGGMLAGCQGRGDRVTAAFARYEAATAASDLPAARKALLELVAEDDSVASYWVQLGKTQLAMTDFAGAYNSFVRAHELDRANPEILGVLTQLALRSGAIELAVEHARQLELVAPQDPAVRLTYGYAALRRDDFAEATDQVTKLLAAAPYDSGAKVLRSRILLQSGQPAEAIEILREQIRLQPSDDLALRALLAVYEREDRWSEAAAIAGRLVAWQPRDRDLRVRLVEAQLRSGELGPAQSATLAGMRGADAAQIERLLAPWIDTDQQAALAGALVGIAKRAAGEQRVAFSRFLGMAGRQRDVIALTAGMATLPVTVANAAANALYGTALTQTRRDQSGIKRLNLVLSLDPGNEDALRGRAQALSRQGKHEAAIEDARKLVSSRRTSAQAWLLMADVYAAAGKRDDVKRTLWEAFHEIPADRVVYSALMASIKADGPTALARLEQEFDDQRAAAMSRSFV